MHMAARLECRGWWAAAATGSHIRGLWAGVQALWRAVTCCGVQILSTIGEDLLVASADKPFRFPAEFTFVVRSFTVLDGIGKSLSPRFDISEISAPYARELILDGKPAFTRLQDRVSKGVRRNNKAVKGLFDSTLKIDEINEALKRCALPPHGAAAELRGSRRTSRARVGCAVPDRRGRINARACCSERGSAGLLRKRLCRAAGGTKVLRHVAESDRDGGVQDREWRQQAARAGAGGGASDAANGDITDTDDVLGRGIDVCQRGDCAVCQRSATGLDNEFCGWGSMCPCGSGQLLQAEAGREEGSTAAGCSVSPGTVMLTGECGSPGQR